MKDLKYEDKKGIHSFEERPIKKILIANRGEIVGRIARTARDMGIKTVSIYSNADINSLHRHFTDESICIGGITGLESYLDMNKILRAVQETGADSVHPGFGFLSENSKFPLFLSEHGIRFIGPRSDVMEALGSKIESKILAESAGVNVIPGLKEPIKDVKKASEIADSIGYPVMIKASAGGGGKGMRIAYNATELKDSFLLVMNESINNYKDDKVFIEKYIESPRHIEIQVLADKHGNVVHLGERECSIQRRNQKIIEEAPSPFFEILGARGDEIRREMGRQAVNLIKKINYYSVATVEFVVDNNGNFYFLEVNTRIQVEHPITEESIRIKSKSGDKKIDLIEWMINVENGKEIDFVQSDIYFSCHAIEARIYAENPERNFMPSSGKIEKFHQEEMDDVRIESGIRKGSDISLHYDPMIAKICAHGGTRNEAIQTLQKALAKIVLFGTGLITNVLFLEKILLNEAFQAGDFTTNFINEQYPLGFKANIDPENCETKEELENILIAHALLSLENIQFISAHNLAFAPFIDKIYIVTFIANKKRYQYKIHIIKNDNEIIIVTINDHKIDREIHIISNEFNVLSLKFLSSKIKRKKINCEEQKIGKFYFKYINLSYNSNIIEHSGSRLSAEVFSEKEFEEFIKICSYHDESLDKSKDELFLKSPLPGVISDILVKEGDLIDPTTNLLIVESMKMQNIITSQSVSLKVKKILVKKGDIVKADQILIEFQN